MPEAPGPIGSAPGLAPFALRDAPSLIERVFPAQKVGVEAQKERKSGAGQTLTALGSYWKGRKPLVLARACILAALLPATEDAAGDLALLDALLAMDERGLRRRQPKVSPAHIVAKLPDAKADWMPHIEPKPTAGAAADEQDEETDETEGSEEGLSANAPRWRWRKAVLSHISKPAERRLERARIVAEREALKARAFAAMSFAEKVFICKRPEEIEAIRDAADPLYAGVLAEANARLGTTAQTLPELVRQLGIARYSHTPIVGDPFAGGGSIPFEAARLGCGVVASDLNPIAAMLTWGALHIIGATPEVRARITEEQRSVANAVDAEIIRLGIEHDKFGNRAKAFLYCVEVIDPQTGWRVPLAPSWVVSRLRRTIARLVPDYTKKRFNILIERDVTAAELQEAEVGTVQDGQLVYSLASEPGGDAREWRIPIARLRGDGEGPPGPDGAPSNRLRLWNLHDVAPVEPEWDESAVPVLAGSKPGAWSGGDILLERLFCIQWMDGEDLRQGKTRPTTWFADPDEADLAREARLRAVVEDSIADWQAAGFVPDMRIEPGAKTDEPIRTRGWTYWHHLFTPRDLLMLSLVVRYSTKYPACLYWVCNLLDFSSRLAHWFIRDKSVGGTDYPLNVFYNQALNVFFNFANRSWAGHNDELRVPSFPLGQVDAIVDTADATRHVIPADLFVFDPPYADAIHYHEITEFFIAWLRKRPPEAFAGWTWDSRRPFAIQGKGDEFRVAMAKTFLAMANAMPTNGLQICMFTHQDSGVWADMAEIGLVRRIAGARCLVCLDREGKCLPRRRSCAGHSVTGAAQAQW